MTPRPDGVVRLMMSYWYYRDRDMSAIVASTGLPTRLMVDSGAFSAHEMRGNSEGVRLADYAAWLADHWPVINAAINLDVISDPRASARNQLALEERGLPVIPVWHSGSPYSELEALCRDYRYVAVGGPAVSEPRRKLLLAMSAKAALIARDHGTALHGLGRSGSDDLMAIPWYSVDASSWQFQNFNGGLILYEDGRRFGLRYAQAARRPDLLRAHGVDPALMDHPSYALLRKRTDLDRYHTEAHQTARATVIALKRFEAFIRDRRPVSPPPGQPDAGLVMYLVVAHAPKIHVARIADGVRWLTDRQEVAG